MTGKNNEKDAEQALDFYRKALNFNVIGRYDPKIKQLLFHTPHASVYKWDFDRDEWAKLEYQGVLAIYLRDVSNMQDTLPPQDNSMESSMLTGSVGQSYEAYSQGEVLSGRDIYNYGLIILNRINPDNFSMGIVPNSVVNKRKVFDSIEDAENPLECMGVEVKDELVIIKNLKHEVYGIWIHTVEDRKSVYELVKYLLENEPKNSFA